MSDRSKTKYDTKAIAAMAMITALAYAVMAVCKIIPKVGGFLSLDAIDAVIGIGGFLFGPAAAVIMIIVEAFIEAITLSSTGWYGFVMNVLSTVLLICPAVYVYRRRRTTVGAAIGLTVGVVCRLIGMILFNYLITPMYFGMPRAAVVDLMPMICIFNLIKGSLNAALLMILYPPVVATLRRVGLVAPSSQQQTKSFNFVPMVIALVVLVGAILAIIQMLKK
ncbi:MAG: ECF transporter S component [Oscillospiraceae bacterium]|nr:ECF transporter S component [Oscillospiraceae bacterium]